MMRPITTGVKLFLDNAPDQEVEIARSRKAILGILQSVVYANVLWLTAYPRTPLLYKSKVIYQIEPPGQEMFADIPTTLEQGWGDCDDLASYRCAELQIRGINARPYLKWRESGPKKNVYHAVVRWPDGRIEDPSLALGMAGHPITRASVWIKEGPMPHYDWSYVDLNDPRGPIDDE